MSLRRPGRRWLWIAIFNVILCAATFAFLDSRFDDIPLWSQVVLLFILSPGIMILLLLNVWVWIDPDSTLGKILMVTTSAAIWSLVPVFSSFLVRLGTRRGEAS